MEQTIKQRIYLEIETKKREFNSRCYFALKAARKGYSVVIAKKNKLYKNLEKLQNGHFILKSAGIKAHDISLKLKKLNYIPYGSDEEGGIIISPLDTSRRVLPKALDQIKFFFSWGNDEKNAILESMPEFKEKIKSVGNPRIDLLKKKNQFIYVKEIKRIKEKYGDFNLYATSFHKNNAIGNSKNPNWLEDQLKVGLVLKEHYNHNKLVDSMQKKNLEKTLDFFKFYDQQKNLPKLIVRPHPAEDNETYTKEIKKLKNIIFIDDQLSIIPWILSCNFFISYNCTAQIECSLLGKRPINLEFETDKDLNFDITRLVSKNINKNIDVINYLRQEKKNYDNFEKLKLINDLALRINNVEDKECAVENICDQINKVKVINLKKDIEISKTKFKLIKLYNIIINYFILIRTLFSKEKKENYKMSLKKNLGISLKEIEENIKTINNIYNYGDFSVKEILPSIFCIEKK